MTHEHLIASTIGGVLLGLGWLAWSGRWRWWTRNEHFMTYPITIIPAGGALAGAYGISPVLPKPLEALVFLVGMLALLVAFALAGWQPRWLGPRWYRWRDVQSHREARLRDVTVSGTPDTPGRSSELTVRRAHRGQQLLARRWAALVGPDSVCPSPLRADGTVPGRLLFYPSELVFAAEPADDAIRPGPTVRTLPVGSITAVEQHGTGLWGMATVVIGVGEQAWRVQTFRPKRLVSDVTANYLTPRYA